MAAGGTGRKGKKKVKLSRVRGPMLQKVRGGHYYILFLVLGPDPFVAIGARVHSRVCTMYLGVVPGECFACKQVIGNELQRAFWGHWASVLGSCGCRWLQSWTSWGSWAPTESARPDLTPSDCAQYRRRVTSVRPPRPRRAGRDCSADGYMTSPANRLPTYMLTGCRVSCLLGLTV